MGAIPFSDVPGFQAYYVVYAPDDTVTAISIFDNVEAAEESNRRALAWIEQNVGPLLAGPVTAVAGPVRTEAPVRSSRKTVGPALLGDLRRVTLGYRPGARLVASPRACATHERHGGHS